MALLVQGKFLKAAANMSSFMLRAAATNQTSSEIQRSVFISQSNDIFSNLALEDWLYRNSDFSRHRVLFLWRNSPCVVIGRHQNPWREAHIGNLTEKNVALARRNSGGGTVYHDEGNLNLSFFTPRDAYNRKANLTVISNALRREWGIDSLISPRDDLILEGSFKQISGTASKLGRPNAYHHCTLLADVDVEAMRGCLSADDRGIKTNATNSVRSAVRNLSEVEPSVTIPGLLRAIGREFLRSDAEGRDRGQWAINQQRGFTLVNPTDDWFPGLDKIRAEYTSWAWRYGKTPDFTVTREFDVPREMTACGQGQLQVQMKVSKGKMAAVTVTIPPGFASGAPEGEVSVISGLEGQEFSQHAVSVVEEAFAKKEKSNEKKRFVADCVRRVVQ